MNPLSKVRVGEFPIELTCLGVVGTCPCTGCNLLGAIEKKVGGLLEVLEGKFSPQMTSQLVPLGSSVKISGELLGFQVSTPLSDANSPWLSIVGRVLEVANPSESRGVPFADTLCPGNDQRKQRVVSFRNYQQDFRI